MEHNCPLDKIQLGYHTWNLLHTIVANYPDEPSPQRQEDINQFFDLIGRLYPCQACGRDFTHLLSQRPPETDSQNTLSEWLCSIHNDVNQKIGKSIFDCHRVNERWRDGWNDGSCD
ncbi:FAD-linked sulfhydryl oxidase ALR-like [Aphis gossypii]|uniref:Sulfhydryl oxidase n=1 Tax=Aphis gossypii TaxID=80765 RepID=A0A9P0NN42_APHGO|nr:FAD-linked sulfhydryl oxidase ALR-like [Aphis gossypii]CAH1731263.1 unnamed protein product [Aphis gossypii]